MFVSLSYEFTDKADTNPWPLRFFLTLSFHGFTQAPGGWGKQCGDAFSSTHSSCSEQHCELVGTKIKVWTEFGL